MQSTYLLRDIRCDIRSVFSLCEKSLPPLLCYHLTNDRTVFCEGKHQKMKNHRTGLLSDLSNDQIYFSRSLVGRVDFLIVFF